MKKVLVESCLVCPHYGMSFQDAPVYSCRRVGRLMGTPKKIGVPEWCPLPDDNLISLLPMPVAVGSVVTIHVQADGKGLITNVERGEINDRL